MISRPNSVPRHTLENIQQIGGYSLNLVSETLLDKAHQTSARYPREVSEFDACGFKPAYQNDFKAPFLEISPLTILMELREIQDLNINATHLIIGEIKKVIIREIKSIGNDGFVDFCELQAVASLGLDAYASPKKFIRKAYAKAT